MSKPLTRFLCLTALAFVAMALVLFSPQSVHAASIVVNSLADNTTAGNSLCTLREAILTANNAGNGDCGANSSANDSIAFNAGGTVFLASTLPNIVTGQGTLTINGGGTVTISGDSDNNGTGDVRIFIVDAGATLTLQNLTITKGKLTGLLASGSGSAVFNSGTLNVTGSTFSAHTGEGFGAVIVS
ncbi:MAG TPA: CSLREA domain-containing protein, partial [Pyrinomonadaceae bacterium]